MGWVDAIHLATGITQNVDVFLTNDRDFRNATSIPIRLELCVGQSHLSKAIRPKSGLGLDDIR